ncbi:hypothetical protein LAC81_37355 (plasmid) [Ensifer adhaerens]|uniref:hypothetical protein n=1 Tax=Ensifer adhaerens TaxID=106592 RepID=UPI001CBAB4FD|nr:hypothetical protein [Ensifer adhaerens]MBZ7927609.1 hypothetical protein [Ensifer adhaerens]UAX98442.1 hypothetical protein LAC78_38660 [Ensifer adhaerens]UAY05822.1 hypothetical protein LAC80_37370 [Ensifer adhaerens]UAY13199.1 hypothetical protein LAC81_37355 [Ensifer adhaerens]
MELLCRCVERAAKRSGYSVEEGRGASRQLMAAPVLQTGPHCLLLTEPDGFYTHLFSLLGLTTHRHEWYIAYHASTVSFAERAKKGPGWLWVGDEPLNVFGLPRSRMDSFSICGTAGPYRFALSSASGELAPNSPAAKLLAELPPGEFASAADAIREANQVLWRRKFPTSVKLLQLDDFDIADLVAEHLDDASSWMSIEFIGNGEMAGSILTAMDRLNTGSFKGWVRRTTDFFWGMENGRIVPLHLSDNVLRAKNTSNFEVKFQVEAIADALRRRVLIPSLYTVFLVTSILPGVRVLGGCRQVIYYPLMRYLAALGFERSREAQILAELRRDGLPGLWGHRVLKPVGDDPFGELESLGGAANPLSQYAEVSLAQSAGDLASFTRDPLWGDLSNQIANGLVSARSAEWRWAGL